MLSELLLTEISRLQHTRLPLHRQLYEALRRAILDGKLGPDERLPSSRDLVHDLQLSRNTVVAALSQLAAEGFLVSRVGSGTFVNPNLPKSLPPRSPRATHQNSPLSHRGQSLCTQFCASGLEVQPFTAGIADFSAFPVALWQRLQNKHWRMTYRSIRPTQTCLNKFKANFLLHRGRFHSGLSTGARARLSTD